MFLRFRTDRSGQTMQTQIRLLLGAVWSGSTLFAMPSASFGCITLQFSHLVQILGWLQQIFPVSEFLGFLRLSVFRTMVTSSFPRIESLEDEFNHIDMIEEPPIAQRMGIMTAFWSFEEFIRYKQHANIYMLCYEKTCLCRLQTTKAQISLQIWAVWSGSLLFTALIV